MFYNDVILRRLVFLCIPELVTIDKMLWQYHAIIINWLLLLNLNQAVNRLCFLSRWPRSKASDSGPEVPGSISTSGKYFMLLFLFCCFCILTFLFQKLWWIMKCFSTFCIISSFSVSYILQSLWPLIWDLRYRHSIFNILYESRFCLEPQRGDGE